MLSLALADNPLNGTAPRPFYIFGHNPNDLDAVGDALHNGANALEPDITLAYPDTPSARCSSDPLLNLVTWDTGDRDHDSEYLPCRPDGSW